MTPILVEDVYVLVDKNGNLIASSDATLYPLTYLGNNVLRFNKNNQHQWHHMQELANEYGYHVAKLSFKLELIEPTDVKFVRRVWE